jgi:hypothetical protein
VKRVREINSREERALLGSVKSCSSQVCLSAVVPALVEPDNRADCESVGKRRVLNHFVHQDPQRGPKQDGPSVNDWPEVHLQRLVRPEDLQRRCPLKNLSQEMSPLDAGFRKRTAFEFPCPSPDRWRFMLMRFTKTQEEWNGAGTFCFLVTLKKHERCEKRRRRIAPIELAHRL